MNIKEVAKLAGVSISTVSRVINHPNLVNEETKSRVQNIIKKTGFIPNSLAKELQQNKTNTIGVILSTSDLSQSSLSHTIDAITDVLKGASYNIMLANSRFHIDEELASFHTFKEKRVDGILYFAASITEAHYLLLKNYHIPIVMIGQKSELLDLPYVVHDDFHASKKATQYLIDKGHRSIGYIGLPQFDEATGCEREKGYLTALQLNKIPIDSNLIVQGNFTLESGYQAMAKLLDQAKALPTAVFAATDIMAIGAIRCLKDHNLSVPQDMSIIGFDDIPISSYLETPLTTIRSDSYAVGTRAANLLMDLIDKEKPLGTKKFVAAYDLIERASVLKRP